MSGRGTVGDSTTTRTGAGDVDAASAAGADGVRADADGRCPWCLGSALYVDYHDSEWGVPCRDERTLFEMINLEGAQAGLSWITILKRREAYRRLFRGFDPARLARFDAADIERLVADPGIVRHRGKIAAVVGNARALLKMHEGGETLGELVWGFVDGEARQNRPGSMADVPASTPVSKMLSRELKARGFAFVGPTIAYAFMQAAGLVNDHLDGCPRQAEVAALSAAS